jgi:single-strand DNA-binding protein
MSQDSNARRNMTVVGNLTGDPDLRYTPSGKAVTKFGLAVNKGHKEGDKWVEEDPEFWNISVWEDQGEHVAESLHKGDRVTVYGRREEAREYERQDGSTGTADHDVTAYEVSASLRYATVAVQRAERSTARESVSVAD